MDMSSLKRLTALLSLISVISLSSCNSLSSGVSLDSSSPYPSSSEDTSSYSSSSDSNDPTSSSSSSSQTDPAIYQIQNGGFETGDLTGWTVLKGTAFGSATLSSASFVNGTVPYNKEGTYFLNSTEAGEGIISSSAFVIGGSGYITLRLGASYMQALTYVSIIDVATGNEIYRIGNSAFNRPASGTLNYRVENMNAYYANLSAHIGKTVYIAVVDQSVANTGFVTIDDIVTYYPTVPSLSSLIEAVNIMPVFTNPAGTPTALYNGDFATKTLAGWTVIGETGVFQASHINSSNRLSNRPDETKTGVLRSSAFKVGGTNVISFRLGATKHRETTYMSVKLTGTNEEIFRTFSDRWKDADEENTHLYHIDLTAYRNQTVYLEFVDNSRGDWGLLTIEAIVTYYVAWPNVLDEIAYTLADAVNTNPSYANMRSYINPYIDAISDATTRTTVRKTFYASLDGISNIKGNWPTVMRYLANGNTFIITGDIDAMWLRDSSAQVLPYLQFMNIDNDVKLMVKGLLRQQFEFIRRNQYANAFNPGGSVFELKFEIDSLIYPLWLAYEYHRITNDDSIFDAFFMMALKKVMTTLTNERNHSDDNYRINDAGDRTVGSHDVNRASGLIWSGYRPSDDVCYYKFFIPGNMFAVATLEKMHTVLTAIGKEPTLASEALTMATEVRAAIETYGVYNHPTFGKIYAFEVTGYTSDASSSNGKLLMDAANIPSLLSIPWLGYASSNDPVYQNTRAFILSSGNPYYYEGTYAKGIGDPHDGIGGTNPHPSVPVPWHMAIAMQGLTSTSQTEIETMIANMTNTTAGTYVMHEAFNANNPGEYSRDWFTWPCALYAHLYITKIMNINLV